MKTKLLFLFSVLLVACSSNDDTNPIEVENRSFYMGVTSWPADLTIDEVNKAYEFINTNCDIVSHHFDDGIPYQEAFTNATIPAEFVQDIQTRKSKTAVGKKVFLSISALDLNRIQKARYYEKSTVSAAIKNQWMQLSFTNPDLITAYVNYVNLLMEELNPIYVNFGVESNAATWNSANFNDYKYFLSQVYQQLKTTHPTIPFMVSFMVDESTEGYNYASQLVQYTDFIALSAYPYVVVSSSANGNTNPANFPANFFERFINLSTTKPFVFAETSYIAENLVVPSFNLNKTGTAEWQNEYLKKITQLCQDKKAKMLIWFCHKDYDAAIETIQDLGLYQDLFLLWRDTGFIDQNGNARPSFYTWKTWLNKTKTE